MSYHDVTGDHPQLEEFAKGEWVLYAQQLLSKAGFDPVDSKDDNAWASGIDGFFGPNTKAAVERFQNAYKLPADGVIGAETWAALESDGSTAHLEFDHAPFIDPAEYGVLKWGVKNTGTTTAFMDVPVGEIEIVDSNNVTILSEPYLLPVMLVPGASNLPSFFFTTRIPPDGDFRATVKLGTGSDAHVASVDFKMVEGKPQPN
jgi:hypothetical protein